MDMLQRRRSTLSTPGRPLRGTRAGVASNRADRAAPVLLQHDRSSVRRPRLHWDGDFDSGRHLPWAAMSDRAERAVHLPAVDRNPSELLRLPPALKAGVNLEERPR